MGSDDLVSAGRAALLAAKARVPALPCPHLPRPRVRTTLTTALQRHRLVVLRAGALTGKTTALAECACAIGAERTWAAVSWYSVDELDTSMRMVLEGLVRATGGAPPHGDELDLLGAVVAALDHQAAHSVLILDDLHRSPAATAVLDRLLRYLPPRAHLVVSTWPGADALPPLYRWLEDQQQVACLDAGLLRLDEDERARFGAATGRAGGAWAVEYRPGGQAAVIDGLRRGVLPALSAERRALLTLLAVVPTATPAVLSAALGMSEGEVTRHLAALREETVLLEQPDAQHYRLTETARQAVLAALDAAALTTVRRAAAGAVEDYDPAHAAHLWAQAGCQARACTTSRRISWWAWSQQSALAQEVAALLPDAALRESPSLALVVAHQRLVSGGARAMQALTRSLRPTEPIESMQRHLLLAYCCAARQRPWLLGRCIAALEGLLARSAPGLSSPVHAYGLLALGIARGFAGLHRGAAEAARSCLDLLRLTGAADAQTAWTRLSALCTLAVAERRQGHLAEAERHYGAAEDLAQTLGHVHLQLEVVNNRAVLLQQRGAHAESAALLRGALATPWSAERGLRPLLTTSLAEALAALGDRAGAAQALATVLDDLYSGDPYGLRGQVHALRALLLAEEGYAGPAESEIAAGATATHAATLLARALLCDPRGSAVRPALLQALEAAGNDLPLRAQVRAHLARVCAVQGDRPQARRWAAAVMHDRTYPQTTRETAILGSRTHRVRPGRRHRPPAAAGAAAAAHAVTVRFFGSAALLIDGQALGSPWWSHSKGRELLWYALAHGGKGFTREEACADLFPERDTLAANRAFRNVLYEVRCLLRAQCGVETLHAGPDGHMHLLPADLSPTWEADTRQVEQCLAQLRAGESEAVRILPALLAGSYLADLYADWTRPFRQYWEREAIHALDLAATQYERAGRAAEAVVCLRREVEFCPDDPAVIRRLMLLYDALGDQSGVRATYHMHCRALREELDAEPDAALVTLYESLTQARAGGGPAASAGIRSA